MYVPMLVHEFLHRAARLYGDKVAVIDGEKRFTYADLQARVNRMSNALLALGVGKGDRVCILSPNSHFFLESFFGTSQIGAILVPLNYRLVAEDHEYILNHAGVTVVLADREYVPIVEQIRPRLRTVRHWISARQPAPPARAGGRAEGEQGNGESAASPQTRRGGSDPSLRQEPTAEGWRDWDEWIGAASPEPPPAPSPELDERDLVSINYTSGTTARPKGVMLSHRSLYLNALNLVAHLGVHHADVELWTLPMFHCNGWGGVYALTGVGGTHVILRAIDAGEIWRLLERERVTFACMAPAVLRTILDHPDRAKHDLKTRPRFTVAGAPPPSAFIERLETELGWDFMEIYGLTETSPLLTISKPDHHTRKEDWARRSRAGVQGLGVEIALLDDDGNEVPCDEKSIGEVCARSNVVFDGYWEQPEETAKAIRDGWFHTGDLAVWDESRSIHIVDRKKDVIISGGENISSPEIEDALFQHPAVLECAVIGVPHEKWGETPKALVVLRPDKKATAAELIEFCRGRLAHFKCPTSVDFLPELPRTATGKLQKYRLRESYWGEGSRRVN